ncbi:MAG: hypothetical protein KDB23_02855 [Planctomycetales bacterium]|nr:hypothetical protein [Planctomycetales bacterium]
MWIVTLRRRHLFMTPGRLFGLAVVLFTAGTIIIVSRIGHAMTPSGMLDAVLFPTSFFLMALGVAFNCAATIWGGVQLRRDAFLSLRPACCWWIASLMLSLVSLWVIVRNCL